MSEQIKPCPYCRGSAAIADLEAATPWVECLYCSMCGPIGQDKADAIAAWNALATLREERDAAMDCTRPRHIEEYHEDEGDVLWWFDGEPPYCGSPLDTKWPGYHTYWTPLPKVDWQAQEGKRRDNRRLRVDDLIIAADAVLIDAYDDMAQDKGKAAIDTHLLVKLREALGMDRG